MLFSSPTFFIFFALFFAVYAAIPNRFLLAIVIVGSTIFYSYWNPYLVWLPHALTIMAYGGAVWISNAKTDRERRGRVAFAVFILLLPLCFFKYSNFVYSSLVAPFTGSTSTLIDLPLPLGISFITFTLIAYLIDVYRRQYPLVRNLSVLSGYVLFFPHLIAGPILRPHELIPQITRLTHARVLSIQFGAVIFALGLVKKLAFADQIAPYVDEVYAHPAAKSGLEIVLAIYGFGLQIYCDFSGYTDMAIGLAFMLGVRLPNNFRQPYCSASIGEFWQRWHITLSHWLRDYLYIPLGGNRNGASKQIRNIMVTMILGGLWHGANWTFVIWGAVHGIGIAVTHIARQVSPRFATIPRWVGVILTFHFVLLTWVLFRAPDLVTVRDIFAGAVSNQTLPANVSMEKYVFPITLILVFIAAHGFDDHRRIRLLARYCPVIPFWVGVVSVILISLLFSAGDSAKFIYFDF